jgi:hypothetical protein
MNQVHITERVECPHCLAALDRALADDHLDNRPPAAGDISLCAHCGRAFVCDGAGHSHALTDDERAALSIELRGVIARELIRRKNSQK